MKEAGRSLSNEQWLDLWPSMTGLTSHKQDTDQKGRRETESANR